VTGDLGQGSPAILAGHKVPVDHPPGWRDATSQVATIETYEVAGSQVRDEQDTPQLL
jgi:hypothetical protein